MEKKEKNSSIYTITDPSLEPYYIQYDQFCYTAVKKIKSGTTGRERDQTIGYYSRLDKCLDVIAEDSAKNQNYDSLKDFINSHKTKLHELRQVITK